MKHAILCRPILEQDLAWQKKFNNTLVIQLLWPQKRLFFLLQHVFLFLLQGMTLPHITLWLDVPCCRAGAYVAMSRVSMDQDYLIAGPVTPKHFVPAK